MKPSKEHLAIINSRLPGTTLTASQVEILPFMVFDNRVTDRGTIMSKEMMAKLAKDLDAGKAAFNKLHESRHTLPVGRSVTSRIVEQPETGTRELHAIMYAVIQRPDGSEFEDGKDLVDRYNTGAVYACSAGVSVGFYQCNICGNDLRDYDKCDHIPGRTYTVNEQPKQCFAIMTGRNIVDGVAEDCGIYEVSAVTAGGVANAGSLTEAFGKYEDGVDPKEFKRTVMDKGIDMRLELSAAPIENQSIEEDQNMSFTAEQKLQVEAMLREHYDPLKQAHDTLKGEYDSLLLLKTDLEGQIAAGKTEYTKLQDEKTALETEFATAKTDLTAAIAAKDEAEGFKAEYVAIVMAKGVKVGKDTTVEAYTAMSLADLKTLNTEYDAEIEKLPVGQQHVSDGGQPAVCGLTDNFYKS